MLRGVVGIWRGDLRLLHNLQLVAFVCIYLYGLWYLCDTNVKFCDTILYIMRVDVKLVFDRKKTATKKTAANAKKGSVQIEVYWSRQRKWLGTDVRIYKDEWRGIEPTWVVGRIDAASLNKRIAEKMQAVLGAIDRMGDDFDPDQLTTDEAVINMTFLEFMEQRIEERRMELSTKRQHRVVYNMLVDYGKIVRFADLTRTNLVKFNDWATQRKTKDGKPITQTTIHSIHKRLKVYVKDALVHGYIEKNPYFGMDIPRGKYKDRMFLTDEEMDRLRTAKMPTESLEKVRDLAVFQMFTGLAYVDLAKFDFKKAENRDGHWFVRDYRQKTGDPFMFVLLSPAVEVLEKYGFALPKMSREQYNMRLKVVMDNAGIDKQLSSHCLRHTFAIYALNHGISTEVVGKILGHVKLATTQIYAKVLGQTVENAMLGLEKQIKTPLTSQPAELLH